MASVNDSVLDAALEEIRTANVLHLCSAEPTSYAEVVSLSLANKTNPTIGAVGDYAGGRQITIAAITDAVGTADGSATHYALANSTGAALLTTQSLSAPFAVTNGMTVEIDSFVIQNPDVE